MRFRRIALTIISVLFVIGVLSVAFNTRWEDCSVVDHVGGTGHETVSYSTCTSGNHTTSTMVTIGLFPTYIGTSTYEGFTHGNSPLPVIWLWQSTSNNPPGEWSVSSCIYLQ
jgi:hypothetical protein